MPIEILTVPCLADNYAYILHDKLSNKTTLVDAPAFDPIREQLEKQNWTLDNILLTHHHDDHIAGVAELVKHYNASVFGAKADSNRLPYLDVALTDRDKFSASNLIFRCIEVPGHTLGHLAFYCASENIVFTGDSLMALGCGRIFEGTPKQMFESLTKLKGLPDNTKVYSGHEYARQNAKFAITVDPDNTELRDRSKRVLTNFDLQIPNAQSTILEEKNTNPFLRSGNLEIWKSLGHKSKDPLKIFTLLREMKNNF